MMLTASCQLTIFHGGTRSPLFRLFPSFSSTLDSSELLRREPFGDPSSCFSSRKDGRNSLEASRGAVDSTVVSSITVVLVNRVSSPRTVLCRSGIYIHIAGYYAIT